MTQTLDILGSTPDSKTAQVRADKIMKGTLSPKEEENSPADEVVNANKLLNKPPVETLSYDYVKSIYPVKIPKKSLEAGVDLMNQAILGIGEGLEEFCKSNMIGLLKVMENNKTNSIEDYVNAVKFITFKQAGDSNVRAYAKVFPDKIKKMQSEGIPNSYLHSYASIFANSVMVTKVQAGLMIPTHIMYQDVYHQAVLTQASIMNDTNVSPKVRSDAANSLLTHLKQPEVKQMEVNVGMKDNSVIDELRSVLTSIADTQQRKIVDGEWTVSDVSETKLIVGEVDERD